MTAAALAAGALVLTGCGGSGSGGGDGSLKVGLAFDVGGLGDKSFNDAAYKGLEKAKKELGAEIKSLAPKDDGSDRKNLLESFAKQRYNVVIGVGFIYTQDVETIAKKYPKIAFGCVDCSAKGGNITNLTFAEEQGSFLVGAAAALTSKTKQVGFIGGEDGALIKKFEAGFAQGAKAADPAVKVVHDYLAVEGSSGAGFRSPDKAKIKADSFFQGGADVVYHAAGQSGGGLFKSAQEASKGGAKKWAIGVDSDQALTDPDYAGNILTSMIKRVDVAVFDFVKAFKDKKKLEPTQVYDLKVDGVGYSTTGNNLDAIKARIEEFKAKIISGDIKVADKPSAS